MKKILLSCACCLLALGLVTACDNEVEEPEEPEVPGTVVDEGGSEETTYLFGFELDATIQYIDGGLVEYNGAPQSNEGAYTDDVSKAAAISCEVSGSTYYLSFDNEGVTNWITIVNGDHPNLSYATEKSPIYLHTSDGGAEYFGDEEGNYFLSYNATYKCVYASSVASWITSSPVCGLYTTEGKLVAGGKGEEPAPAIEPVLGTVKEGDYFLGVTMSEVNYYFDGTLSGYYGSVSSNGYDAAVVTVAAASDGYTLSIGESDDTQYLYAYVANGYVDFGLQTDPFTWQYDTTFETFVVELNDQWNFIGTYGTNQRLGMNDYGYLTGDKSTNNAQYAAELFDVITYVAPTGITVTSGEELSVVLGQSLQLTATATGEGNVDPRVTWSSSAETIAAITSDGLVRGLGTGSATITATSVANSSVSGTISITVSCRGAAVYQESEIIVPGDYYSYVTSSSLDLTSSTTYGSLVDITYAQNNGQTNPQYYVSGASIRVYANNSITFTAVDSSVAVISSVVITYASGYGGNSDAEVTYCSDAVGTVTDDSDAKTLTLSLAAGDTSTNSLTLTNWKSASDKSGTNVNGGTQLRIESITINYASVS